MSEIAKYWRKSDREDRLRVMTVSEGYALVRWAGCAPFVVTTKELVAGFTPETGSPPYTAPRRANGKADRLMRRPA